MPKTKVDSKGNKELSSRLPYEKPCLKAIDLHANEIMGTCYHPDDACGITIPPTQTGPS